MTYPPAPWNMHGQLWLSLFRVREGDHPDRPAGVYGAALVSYEQPSPLTYSELLVARQVRRPAGSGSTSPTSGSTRPTPATAAATLWAIPKDLCDFRRDTTGQAAPAHVVDRRARRAADRLGAVHRRLERHPAHAVQGRDLAGARGEPGERRSLAHAEGQREGAARAAGTGSSTTPGPLAWLAGKRPLASFRMADFSDVLRLSPSRRRCRSGSRAGRSTTVRRTGSRRRRGPRGPGRLAGRSPGSRTARSRTRPARGRSRRRRR